MRGGGLVAPAPGPQPRGAGSPAGSGGGRFRLNPERERGRGALPPGRPGSGAPKFLPRAALPPRNAGICWVGRGKGLRTRQHQTRAIGAVGRLARWALSLQPLLSKARPPLSRACSCVPVSPRRASCPGGPRPRHNAKRHGKGPRSRGRNRRGGGAPLWARSFR